mgnify:CR=1 FL=1
MITFNYQNNVEQQWINKNEFEICSFITLFFILLIILLNNQFYKLSNIDIYTIYLILISQLSTLYSCYIQWNPEIIAINHYFLLIVITFVLLFSKNIMFLIYFLSIVLLTLLLWSLKKNRCIFDNLKWELHICGYKIENKPEFMAYSIIPVIMLYVLKIIYIYHYK